MRKGRPANGLLIFFLLPWRPVFLVNIIEEEEMFGLGTPELVVILGIAFLVFGGKKLPEIGAGLGKGINSFKKGLRDVEDSGRKVVEDSVPGVAEINELKEKVDDIKQAGNLIGK